jgi:hypothetical protein
MAEKPTLSLRPFGGPFLVGALALVALSFAFPPVHENYTAVMWTIHRTLTSAACVAVLYAVMRVLAGFERRQ